MVLCGAASPTTPLWAAWDDPALTYATPNLEAIQNGSPEVYYVYHVATGKFLTYNASRDKFLSTQKDRPSTTENFHLMRGRVDVTIGGGAQSDHWMQMMADVTGIPVSVPENCRHSGRSGPESGVAPCGVPDCTLRQVLEYSPQST